MLEARGAPIPKQCFRPGEVPERRRAPAQFLAALYGLLALLFPHVHFQQFSNVFRDTEDTIPEDQSLVIDTEKGLVLISGCGRFIISPSGSDTP